MTIELANRLTKLRKEHGFSQEDLADKLGVSRQAVSKWERAEATPDMDNLIELSKIYNISLDEVVGNKIEDKNDKAKVTVKKGNDVIVELSDKDDEEDDEDKKENGDKRHGSITEKIEWLLTLFALIAYLLLGFLGHLWWNMWILFFVPDIIVSTYKAIRDKNPNRFNMPFLCVFLYFFLCMVTPRNIWHPAWVIFLAIPIYYTICGIVTKKK